MLKKSLIFGGIVLFVVILFALTGCEGPVGPPGTPGESAPPSIPVETPPVYMPLGDKNVDKSLLARSFDRGDVIYLLPTVETVEGEVPPGCELLVLGNTRVADHQALTVKPGATLTIGQDASLEADGVGSGLLASSGGNRIEGEGVLILPYVVSGTFTKGFHFKSGEVQGVRNRYVGSTSTDGEDPVELTSAGIHSIFAEEDELTVYDIKGLTLYAIPAGKKLRLAGTGNTINVEGVFTLSNAELEVAAGAKLDVSSGSVGAGIEGKIINLGEINLNEGGAIVTDQGQFINDSLIITATEDAKLLKDLLLLAGNGNIESKGKVESELPGDELQLTQKLYITEGSVKLFNSPSPLSGDSKEEPKIFIYPKGTLILQEDTRSVGVKVDNKGTIETETTDASALEGIFDSMDSRGTVKAIGAITTGVTLTIPTDVELKITNADSTFENPSGDDEKIITVEGKLSLEPDSDIKFSPNGDLVIKGALHIKNGVYKNQYGKYLVVYPYATLTGEGIITFATDDADTDAYLFIKESEAKVAPLYGIEPRLDSIPTTGLMKDTGSDGIACKKFQQAREAVRIAKRDFEEQCQTTYYSQNFTKEGMRYVGIAEIDHVDRGAPVILNQDIDNSPEKYFKFSEDIKISQAPDIQITTDTIDHPTDGAMNKLLDTGLCYTKLVVDEKSRLAIDSEDPLWDDDITGITLHDALLFTRLRFVKDNFIGRQVEPFYIAVYALDTKEQVSPPPP